MNREPATLNDLLDTALDLPAGERARWLETLPGEYDSLKPRLRALLERAAEVETSDFLGTLPKIDLGATVRSSETAGDLVGPYRLVRELGTGGMGTVWLAEGHDGALRRRVALKLIRAHTSRDVLAERMARERDILAALEHPHIARLYDAGVSDKGIPYLALEYVEGEPIIDYCRKLDTRARVRLFLQVAEAVAYAHAKLVVHRDLKPANILVTADGQVHLLDFGIAKLLDEGRALETHLTRAGGRAFTPEYASPEQLLGEPLTISSDLYSLGVTFYEALTGQRPYRLKRASLGALEDAVLAADPPRPSEVAEGGARRALQGDLDTIALKALKKKPFERYATVNAFADDLHRYLDGRPVLARPDSVWYRTRKFVSRHRLTVGAGVAVVLAITIGGVAAMVQGIEAGRQRDEASRQHEEAAKQRDEAARQRDVAFAQQRRAQAYSDFMGVLLQDAGAGDRPLKPTELLDRGVQMLEQRAGKDQKVDAYMWYELSRNYLLFVQTDRELALLERAAAGARTIGDSNLLAASECSATWTLGYRDRVAARTRFESARRVIESILQPADYAILDCARAEASLRRQEGDFAGAIEVINRARARVSGPAPSDWRNEQLMATLSDVYRASGRFKDALEISAASLAAVRDAGRAGSMAELVSLNNHGGNLCGMGEYLACAEVQGAALALLEKSELTTNQPLAVRQNYGTTLWRLGQPQRALELADEERAAAERAGNRMSYALCHLLAARALLDLGRRAESLQRLEAAEAVWNADPKAYARLIQESNVHRAWLRLAAGDAAGAATVVRGMLKRAGYPAQKGAPGLDRVLRVAARAALQAGDAAAAEQYATDALAISQRIARAEDSSADAGLAALMRAEARVKLGRADDAVVDAGLALRGLRNGLGPEHADTRAAARLETRLRGETRT